MAEGEDRIAVLEAVVRICERQLDFYAQQHRAKVLREISPAKMTETLDKARVNEELVDMIRAVRRGEIPELVRQEMAERTDVVA